MAGIVRGGLQPGCARRRRTRAPPRRRLAASAKKGGGANETLSDILREIQGAEDMVRDRELREEEANAEVFAAFSLGRDKGGVAVSEVVKEAEEEAAAGELLEGVDAAAVEAFFADDDDDDDEGGGGWGGLDDVGVDLGALTGASAGAAAAGTAAELLAAGDGGDEWDDVADWEDIVLAASAPARGPGAGGGPAADGSEGDDDGDDDGWDGWEEVRGSGATSAGLAAADAADESLEFLAQMDVAYLDRDSRALVEEELRRARRVAGGSGAPGEGGEASPDGHDVVLDNTPPPPAPRRTHARLTVVAGSAGRVRLLSPDDMNTRPMMAVVRGALFDMLLSVLATGSNVNFPPGSRWLDLYAGTGAVGIEALSRGCEAAAFVELDPWCVNNCLRPNLGRTGLEDDGSIHVQPVEAFLRDAARDPRGYGGAGAYRCISATPPYQKVDYPELLGLLSETPLLAEGGLVTVEYSLELKRHILPSIGRLEKIRDRRYGRTYIAVYKAHGPPPQPSQ